MERRKILKTVGMTSIATLSTQPATAHEHNSSRVSTGEDHSGAHGPPIPDFSIVNNSHKKHTIKFTTTVTGFNGEEEEYTKQFTLDGMNRNSSTTREDCTAAGKIDIRKRGEYTFAVSTKSGDKSATMKWYGVEDGIPEWIGVSVKFTPDSEAEMFRTRQ